MLKIVSQSVENWRSYEWRTELENKEDEKERITRLDQSNVLDWQVSSILLKT